MHAARHYGCRVVTTTISREQYDHVVKAVRAAGLESQVSVLSSDYRDLPSRLDRRFDKVVSIEMIEAVGYAYLDRYFEVCEAMTKPGGVMLLQSIVIADAFYEAYRRSVDVIQRYIFPGGFLPSLVDLERRITQSLLRMWEYYFCYCEGGFLEQTIGNVQLLLTKARS